MCVHKPIFPLNYTEMVGCFATFFLFLASNSGGLGGGGATLPVYILFFRFDLKQTIALSNASGLTSGLLRFFLNLNKTHPLKTDVNGKGP